MRVATGYSFWKMNRIINADLKAGTYTMTIGSNFPTAAFGGKKGFVLSNATPFGGNRTALGVSYLVVGLMALVAAVVFGVMSLLRERGEKPQIRYTIPDLFHVMLGLKFLVLGGMEIIGMDHVSMCRSVLACKRKPSYIPNLPQLSTLNP